MKSIEVKQKTALKRQEDRSKEIFYVLRQIHHLAREISSLSAEVYRLVDEKAAPKGGRRRNNGTRANDNPPAS